MERIVKAADGMDVYVTAEGDMVDLIAYRYYGQHGRNAEAIFAENPGLAARGPVLPAGVPVRLPRITQQIVQKPFRRLWD